MRRRTRKYGREKEENCMTPIIEIYNTFSVFVFLSLVNAIRFT